MATLGLTYENYRQGAVSRRTSCRHLTYFSTYTNDRMSYESTVVGRVLIIWHYFLFVCLFDRAVRDLSSYKE